MNRKEFLEQLDEYLVGIPKNDKDEIMQDYKEHFKIGKKEKRADSEIIKSLGDPKEIAREVRNQLTSSEKIELKSEAIEVFVGVKRLSKHLYNEALEGITKVVHKENKPKGKNIFSHVLLIGMLVIGLLLLFNNPLLLIVVAGIIALVVYVKGKDAEEGASIKDNKVKSKKQETSKKSAGRVVISILFNLFFFIWFWIQLFAIIIAVFIGSIALIIAGVALIVFATFSLINHSTEMIKSLLLSGLFSGIGILILGGLIFYLSKWVAKMFFVLTKKYIDLNMRFIRK